MHLLSCITYCRLNFFLRYTQQLCILLHKSTELSAAMDSPCKSQIITLPYKLLWWPVYSVCCLSISDLYFLNLYYFDTWVLTDNYVCFYNLSAHAAAQPVKCEVCGTYFESRRGLSSHARLHLRQLGVALSESSGAPISLLYQLVRERDGCLPELKADSSADGMALLRNTSQLESRNLSEPEDPSQLNPQTKSFAELPTRPKESMHSLLPLSPSCSTLFESRASEGSSSSCAENQTRTKPLWAPLETDAPIRLGMAEFWMYLRTLHF